VNAEYVVKPSELCKPGKCSAAAAPVMSVTALGFAHLVLPSLKPDYVVWNCGHWSGKLLLSSSKHLQLLACNAVVQHDAV
jgi:hypothetical protein